MFTGLIAAAAGPLGKLAKDKAVDLLKGNTAELFDEQGNKVHVPPGKTPVRALAQAILANADLVESYGGSEETRIEAVESLLVMVISEQEGAADAVLDNNSDDDDDGSEPPG